MLTVPPTALLTVLMLRVWPLSLAGPFESFAVKVEAGIVTGPESSATLDRVSLLAVGASFTSVIVKLAVAVSLFRSCAAFLVVLSAIAYWKLAAPLKLAVGVK